MSPNTAVRPLPEHDLFLERFLGLRRRAPSRPTGDSAPPPVTSDGPKEGRTVAYRKLLLAWDAAKKKVYAELQKLEQALLDEYADDPDLPEMRQKVRKLDEVLGGLDDRLQDKLDEALNANGSALPALHRQAVAVIEDYEAYVENDAFIDALEDNPLMPLSVRKTLATTLAVLGKQLS
jgi:hypothetical protein